MLRLARKYAAKFDFPVNLAAADVCYLPYDNETFDFVIAVATYHHLEKRAAIDRISRIKAGFETGRLSFYYRLEPPAAAFLVQRERSQVPWKIKE